MNNLTKEEIEALEACSTPAEYSTVAHAIKAAHNGMYPDNWWATVMLPGGISERLAAKWGKPDAFEMKLVSPKGKG